MGRLTDVAFRLMLDALMCNDPIPEGGENPDATLCMLVDDEAKLRGYDGWVDAYHEFECPDAYPNFNKEIGEAIGEFYGDGRIDLQACDEIAAKLGYVTCVSCGQIMKQGTAHFCPGPPPHSTEYKLEDG